MALSCSTLVSPKQFSLTAFNARLIFLWEGRSYPLFVYFETLHFDVGILNQKLLLREVTLTLMHNIVMYSLVLI